MVLATVTLAALLMTGCNCNETVQPVEKTDNGKIAIDNIMTRTSIRSFTDRQVSADTIEMLIGLRDDLCKDVVTQQVALFFKVGLFQQRAPMEGEPEKE